MSYSDSKLWFSYRGRINRRPYFFAALVSGGLLYAHDLIPKDNNLIAWLYLPVILVAIYVSIVLAVKRSHDRGRSGWFILVTMIPVLNFWPFIELTFLKGTNGPNKYGEDPLANG